MTTGLARVVSSRDWTIIQWQMLIKFATKVPNLSHWKHTHKLLYYLCNHPIHTLVGLSGTNFHMLEWYQSYHNQMSSSLYQCIHSHNRCICTQSDNPEIPLTWFPNEEFTQRESEVIIYPYHFLGCKQPCFSIKFYSVPLKRILTALFIIFLVTFSEEVIWLNTVKISKFNCPEEKWNEPWLCMMVQNSCTLADLSKTINWHTTFVS